MIRQEQLIHKIAMLPSPLLQIVDMFVDFLLARFQQNGGTTDGLDAASMSQIAVQGQAFEWLQAPAEDGIYSDSDGEPI